MEIKGKYATAKIFTKDVEAECQKQIQEVCNLKIFENSNIRIMPDCHSGKGCVVGFTAKVKDKIIPNLIGVDISCSVSTYKLDTKEINFELLDKVIKNKIPTGNSTRNEVSNLISKKLKEEILKVNKKINSVDYLTTFERDLKSIGTLGGGNHFIEIDKDYKNNNYYLTIHTGSRNFGKRICEFYQNKAYNLQQLKNKSYYSEQLKSIPKELRESWIKEQREEKINNPSLCFLDKENLLSYKEDMEIARKFAKTNHKVICQEIVKSMGWNILDSIYTNHNYIEFLDNDYMIIRKGAISAKKNQKVLIPINMRDGMIIGVGKGNEDYNFSAPHGAGRIYSRAKAKQLIDIEMFKNSMIGIYSSCINEKTLDESPFAYKDLNSILENIGDTIKIIKIVKPVYNFKGV